MWMYLNGRMVEDAEARISVLDRGFLYGDGVFETVRIHHGRPLWLDRHLARLSQSCRAIHLDAPSPAVDWPDVFQRVIDRNRLTHALIRLTLSRGSQDVGAPALTPAPLPQGEGGHRPSPFGRGRQGEGAAPAASYAGPTVVLMPRPLRHVTARQRHDGVPIILTAIRRPALSSGPTHVKTLNCLNSLLALREATARGAFEGLQLTLDGHLAECAMSNIFFVMRSTLHTPSLGCGILPGITRGLTLDAARDLGLPTREGRYLPDVLDDAEECFLTGSGIGILRVSGIDGRPLPPPPPDSRTATLQRRYERMMEEHR